MAPMHFVGVRVHLRRTKTVLFPQRNWGAIGVYCEVADTSAVHSNGDMPLVQSRGAPWFPITMIHPLVAWRQGAMTPFRKLYNLSDRVCPRQVTKVERRRFRKWARRLFGVNSLADFSLQILYISFLERCVGQPHGTLD